MRSKDMTIPSVGRVYFEPEMKGTPKRIVLIRESYHIWKAEVTIDENGPYQVEKKCEGKRNYPPGGPKLSCDMPFNFSLHDGNIVVTRQQYPNSLSAIFDRGIVRYFDNSNRWYAKVKTEETIFFAYFFADKPDEILIGSRPNLHLYMAKLQTKTDRKIELLGWKLGGRKTEKRFRAMFETCKIRPLTFQRTLEVEKFFME